MLSLDPTLHEWLSHPVQTDRQIKLKEAVKAHFGQFVKGEEIDDLDYIKRVSDRRAIVDEFGAEVWSLRPDFYPVWRFFGAFFREDWLVVLTKERRDNLVRDEDWHAQIDDVSRKWDDLFSYQNRHSGATLRDYVTFGAEHYDDRW